MSKKKNISICRKVMKRKVERETGDEDGRARHLGGIYCQPRGGGGGGNPKGPFPASHGSELRGEEDLVCLGGFCRLGISRFRAPWMLGTRSRYL